jgi:hypothetical protein
LSGESGRQRNGKHQEEQAPVMAHGGRVTLAQTVWRAPIMIEFVP